MKRSYTIIIMLSGLFTTFLIFPYSTFAMPYSEKVAFCLDRQESMAFFLQSNLQKTRFFNDCIKNAEATMEQIQKDARAAKEAWKAGAPERARKEEERRKRAKKARKARDKAEREAEQLKKNEIKRQNDLFDAFN